jgi:hypothetical protein
VDDFSSFFFWHLRRVIGTTWPRHVLWLEALVLFQRMRFSFCKSTRF